MTRKEALEILLAQVKAGDWDFSASAPARYVFPYNSSSADDLGLTARAAFDGSLDAAKALHEAVLPDWEWEVSSTCAAAVFKGPELSGHSEFAAAATSARAWLIVILKAMIVTEAIREVK